MLRHNKSYLTEDVEYRYVKKIGPIVIHKITRFTYPGSRHYRSFQVARESENRKDFLRIIVAMRSQQQRSRHTHTGRIHF